MVLALVRENNYDGDYLVMLDLDFDHIPDPSKLFEKINSDEDIDAIFGMSTTNKDKFYDYSNLMIEALNKSNIQKIRSDLIIDYLKKSSLNKED